MSGITDPGDKAPAEIEREVEQTRSQVSSTLDELRTKLKPSHMVDEVVGEAVDWVKGSGGAAFARNLGAAVRDNPLPVALIGAGLAWLLLSGGRSDAAPPPAAGRSSSLPDLNMRSMRSVMMKPPTTLTVAHATATKPRTLARRE